MEPGLAEAIVPAGTGEGVRKVELTRVDGFHYGLIISGKYEGQVHLDSREIENRDQWSLLGDGDPGTDRTRRVLARLQPLSIACRVLKAENLL